ncbi:polysaccharide deacetylase family protein [Niallia sp. 03190]|uniref:polysaccharide deacetylase family protein n=1 Tax=Niallia sp. 03190 TaxID=3458061 RepID=UPI004044BB67
MKKAIPLIGLLLVSWIIVNNPLSNTYVASLKSNSVLVGANKNELYEEISKKADDFRIEPEDAKLDPVWKAIPGINGLEVNVDASYHKMKDSGKFNKKNLVFKQIRPSVHLKDLPPSPIYKGNPNKQMVCFIINVAWGNEYLPDMLAILKKHHVKASFFLEGRWTQKNPDLAKMIVEAGNEVGNHSYTHPDMSKISSEQIKEEITKTNEVIEATTGKAVTWFAPPSGSYNMETVKIANNYKLGTLMWSIDTIDWQKPAPNVLIHRVVGKVHNGAMILMHPTASTASALESLIVQIQAKGLEINTVSEMLSEERNVVYAK